MRTIIAGSRSITDYATVERAVRLSGIEITEVISGKARGPDLLGERWAKEHDVPVNSKPANWNKYGPSAGPIRNREMAEEADALVAVWDGVSKGTKDMIKVAKQKGLKVHIHVKGSLEELFD
jgi:hypothetical protein